MALLGLWSIVWLGNDLARVFESDAPSVSHGTTADGWLEHGKRLPSAGDNFRTYSRLGALIGRNAVHGRVRDAMLEAYSDLSADSETAPLQFVYGETGWPAGGPFRPHKTHRNGLSVDFMTPAVNEAGRSVPLPTSVFNLWGYRHEFDAEGQLGDLRIDYEALGLHLLALEQSAQANGLRIRRVIFDPQLQPDLVAAVPEVRRLQVSERRSWVRHDEHYHVDFELDD
ncbi:MAG: penicillin-insensitive murein endopeptidase [Bacteroidota bacterium]